MALTKVTYSMIDGTPIYVKDYGAIGDGVADDTAAIQAALTAGAGNTTIFEPDATYKVTSGLTIYGTIDGRDCTLMFYGAAISALVSQNVEASIYNITIDGTNVASCERGLLVNTDFDQVRPCYYRLKIQNIGNTNNTQPAEGANFFRSSGSGRTTGHFDISIDVENIVATPNGIIGDNGGAAMGIGVGANGTATDMFYYVHDCTVRNITPAEDAIAFYALTGNHTAKDAKGMFVWENCRAYESRKYSFKIQAPNATIRNCFAQNITTDQAEQFTAYGYNVTFDRCVSRITRETGGYAFATRGRRTTFSNCKSFSDARNPHYGIYTGAESCTLANCYAENDSNWLLADDPIIRYEGSTQTVISNFTAFKRGTTGIGTVIEITLTGVDLNINGLIANGFHRGLYPAYSSGTIRLRNARLNYGNGSAIDCLGDAGQIIEVSDSEFTGANGIVVPSLSVYTVYVDNCIFNTPNVGLGVNPGGLRVTNSVFNSDTILSGAAIVCTNVVARNNRINKFMDGIDYSGSTTAEVADNVCVDTANPFITVGVTPFVNTDNFSR